MFWQAEQKFEEDETCEDEKVVEMQVEIVFAIVIVIIVISIMIVVIILITMIKKVTEKQVEELRSGQVEEGRGRRWVGR